MLKKNKKPHQIVARKLVTFHNPKSSISEQFRTLRTNIHFSSIDQELKTIAITSPSPSEGKSTCTANLAITFAQEGKRVLLIDADMRKPTMQYTFQVKNGLGLSTLLARQNSLKEVLCTTKIKNLDVLPCGPVPPNPAELIGSKTMKSLIEQLKELYDFILFDTSPLLSVADAQILASLCDGTIIVVNTGSTEKANALKAKEVLQSANANILGMVMNNYTFEKDHYYYHSYSPEGQEMNN